MSVLGPNTRAPWPAGTTSAGAWDDLQGSVVEGAGGAALTFAALRDTPFKLAAFRNAQTDELHFVYQMSHRWETSTSVKPHLHFIPLTDPAVPQVVRFSGYYVFVAHQSGEVPALAGWTAFTVDFTINPGDVNKALVRPLFTVAPPAGAVESDMLLVYLSRLGSDPADTYTGNLAALSSDVHFQTTKLGSDAEFPGA